MGVTSAKRNGRFRKCDLRLAPRTCETNHAAGNTSRACRVSSACHANHFRDRQTGGGSVWRSKAFAPTVERPFSAEAACVASPTAHCDELWDTANTGWCVDNRGGGDSHLTRPIVSPTDDVNTLEGTAELRPQRQASSVFRRQSLGFNGGLRSAGLNLFPRRWRRRCRNGGHLPSAALARGDRENEQVKGESRRLHSSQTATTATAWAAERRKRQFPLGHRNGWGPPGQRSTSRPLGKKSGTPESGKLERSRSASSAARNSSNKAISASLRGRSGCT